MRYHGEAIIDPSWPRAAAICDRCGRFTNRERLAWQYDWRMGPRLINLRILVCESCYDKPQESGRTLVLPIDPVPIMNARPEWYANADNPMSANGANANPLLWQYSAQIGNLTQGAGVPSAFDGNLNKRFFMSATRAVTSTDYNNWLGINWGGDVSDIVAPSSLSAPVQMNTVAGFVVQAPNDRPFLNSAQPAPYHADQSADGKTWMTFYSGTTVGTVGEKISVTTTSGNYQYHRVAFEGDGTSLSVAQLQFTLANAAQNDI